MDSALAAAPRLAAPTLFMYGAHDEVIPRPPIEEFVAHLPPDPGYVRRLAYYAAGYHMLLRDLDGATVAGDVASWIRDRGAKLPSRADATAERPALAAIPRPQRLSADQSRLHQPARGGNHQRGSGPVAQLDRALPSEGRGRTFESCRVRHLINSL